MFNLHRTVPFVLAVLSCCVITTRIGEAATAPVPVNSLQTGRFEYVTHVKTNGVQQDVRSTLEIKAVDDTFQLTDTATGPDGSAIATDVGVVTKSGLNLVSRSIMQGPVTVKYKVSGTKIEGNAFAGGAAQPIAAELPSPLFGDGPGAHVSIGALPLSLGFATELTIFSPQTMQVMIVPLSVVGEEKVKVQAGEFDCWKVEMSAPGGVVSTIWISKVHRRLVRSSVSAPQLNGGSLVMEMTN